MKYNSINLKEEDAYDDCDYAEYETMDYESDDEECEDEPEQEKTEKRNPDERVMTIYNEAVPKKSQEDMREYFAGLVDKVKNGTPAEKSDAEEQACLHLRGVVYRIIRKQYQNYIDADPTFEDDLVQSAFMSIITNLPRYDAAKGQPSTYFYNHISSALYAETNSLKHQTKGPDTTLKRKIKQINKKYADRGEKATIADYIVETGESSSRIREVMEMSNRDMNTHLEAIEDYDQTIQGDQYKSEDFDNPESIVMRNMVVEAIEKHVRETFSETEADIFFDYTMNDIDVPTIAKAYGYEGAEDKVRRIIGEIIHNVKFDVDIRRMVSDRVRSVSDDSRVFSILPLEGTDANMDLLEEAM